MIVDERFEKAFPLHMEAVKNNTTPLPTDFECYRKLINAYESSCEKMDDYSLKYMKAFVAECEGMKSLPGASDESVKRIEAVCSSQ